MTIVEKLQTYLAEHNAVLKPLLAEFQNASELVRLKLEESDQVPEVRITLKSARGLRTEQHMGTYHLPTAVSEVAAVINSDMSGEKLMQVILSSPKPDSKFKTVILDS